MRSSYYLELLFMRFPIDRLLIPVEKREVTLQQRE